MDKINKWWSNLYTTEELANQLQSFEKDTTTIRAMRFTFLIGNIVLVILTL